MFSGSPFTQVRYVGPPGWRRLPPVTRATLALSVAGYLLGLAAPGLSGLLIAEPRSILRGLELWRLVSYPLVVLGIWNLLFGLLLFWAFGSELEPGWGSRSYALFLLAATLSASLLGTLAAVAFPVAMGAAGFGISGLLTATIVAWALIGPGLPVSFFGVLPMTRGGFAVLSLVIVVFGELDASRSLARVVFLLGGIPVAWAWTRKRGGGWRPRPGGTTSRLFGRRRFRVVRRDDPSRFHRDPTRPDRGATIFT